MKRSQLIVLSGSCVMVVVSALVLARPPSRSSVDPSCYGSSINPNVRCPGEEVDSSSAIATPSRRAWYLFAELNQPAFPGNSLDTRRVWETWKNADDPTVSAEAIYLKNGHAPAPWNVAPVSLMPQKVLVPNQRVQFQRVLASVSTGIHADFDTPPAGATGEEEVRTNRPAFNFILQNNLYNQQGQLQFASTNLNFDFPRGSKEIKANWILAGSGDNVADYYSAKSGGNTYLLVSMHIITKDLPFWLWTSFVHKDKNKDARNGYVAPLSSDQGVPPSIQGTPLCQL